MIPVQIHFLENTPKRLVFRQLPIVYWLQVISGVLIIVRIILNGQGASFYSFFIFILVCLWISYALVLGGQILTCTFDKTISQVTLVRQGIQGTHVTRVSLQDISLIELDIHVHNRLFLIKNTYKIYFLLMSGKRVCLNFAALYNGKEVRDLAWLISNFLQLRPYTENNN
jgi:hypothetical protein